MIKLPYRQLALVIAVTFCVPALGRAQDGPVKVESLKEVPPEGLEAPIKDVLKTEGTRVTDGAGEPFVDFWLRDGVPASGKPAGPEGAVLFPILEVGQLVGAVRFNKEGYDYRDQPIEPGVYTLRYGLQPINGDHLGVSTYRDYLMLVPAKDDVELAPIEQETLDIISADAAMTNHPAVFLMGAAPENATAEPGVVHNEEKDQWGVVLPIGLKVEGKPDVGPLKVQLIVVGRGPV